MQVPRERMPYRFSFKSTDGSVTFDCPLTCSRCIGTNVNGGQCSRKTCIGTPYCWMHLWKLKQVRIRPSTIPNAGKGIFAVHRPGTPPPANDIVFRKGDTIIEYAGEKVTRQQIDARYGDYTAPYGLGERGKFEDGACVRGVGTMANSASRKNCNAEFRFQNGRFVLKARKTIKTGAEILCDYGNAYVMGSEPVTFSTKYKR